MRGLLIICLPFVFFKAEGQPADTATSRSGFSGDSLVNAYYTYYQQKSQSLYNGRQFYGYPVSIEGHAFYRSDRWSAGAVLYDGLWHPDVSLMYDIYRDEVIVKHPNQVHVILYSPRVQQFIIGDQTFAYLGPGKNGDLPGGFYHQLVNGKVNVYVKRAKLLEEKIDGLILERKFVTADQFYVEKDGRFYPVRKQQDLMRVLQEKRQELSRFKSREALKFKSGTEQFIVRMTEHFNEL